ncbi:insulinase family protein [Dysgonomonas sp. Marseille-P4677]|uniref:M16 family metallopeptidase n=1 Tax=Dysgonomonas sp. Marseille-P4677 TaxID=2364790 RepID=UPI0019115409|nr:M16 family metallopeptidase [Dysgonomonas sp. Marseille-P4677]MBK5719907.1 insulinase family protein [Dysgonomonas sp. Marseille-P4677]
MRKITILLVLFVITSVAKTQNLPFDPQIRQGKLDNGLTYFIRHNNYPENRAAYYLVQKVGSIQEDDNQAGLAHFLEHMAFGSTKNFPQNLVGSLEKYGAKIGENINAYTSFDQTVYFLDGMPTDNKNLIDSCLLVLHDWSGFITLKDDAIDKERKVIKEEWRSRTGAYSRIWDKQLPIIFKGSKYADRMPIGKMDIIENFKYQELNDYYKKWYRPDLQGIIVVGNVDVDHVEKQLKTIFTDIPKPVNPAERVYYPVSDNTSPIISVVTDPEATSTNISLYIKHDTEPENQRNTKEWLIQEHIRNMVSQMLSARLNEISQRPDAPFSSAYSYYGNYFVAVTKKAWTSSASVKEGKVNEALTILIQENERAKQYGFTEGEIERAKANLLQRYENSYNNRDKQSNGEIINVILHNFLISGPITGIEYEYKMLKEILPTLKQEAFNSFIKKAITDNNVVLTVSGPEKEGLKYPSETDLINLMAKVKNQPLEAYVETLSKEPLISNLPQPGKVVDTKRNGLYDETEWTLSNGIKVILKKTTFHNDQIVMSALAKGGSSIFSDEEILNASFINAVSQIGGVGNFSTTDLPKILAGKSVSVWPSVSDYTQAVKGNSTIKDFETMLQLTYLYLTSPRKDEDAFKAFVENRKNSMLNNAKNPSYIFSDSINKTLYGNQPRARKIEVADIDKLDYDRMISMYKECFANPGSFIFTFVGTLDEEIIKPLIEKYLGCLPSGNLMATYKEINKKIRKGVIKNNFTQAMETPKATSFIYYTALLDLDFKANIAPAFKRDVLNGILDQIFFRTLRGDEGGTYGASANFGFDHIPSGESRLQIYFNTDPKRVNDMNAVVYREIKELADNGPRKDEFDKAIENVIKKRTEYLKMNGYWSATTEIIHFYGEDENTDYINRIRSITPADIQQLVKDIISQGNLIEVVMTPKE